MARWGLRGLIFWAVALAAIPGEPALAQTRPSVSLELVLLVDVSASVSDEEYHLQTVGLATALRSPRVLWAFETMTSGGVAICLVQWADQYNQQLVVDWTLVRGADDALRLAERVESSARQIHGGPYGLGRCAGLCAPAT